MIQKLSFNLGIATLSRLIIGGIGLITVGLLTRNLGPAAFGQYSSIFAYLYVFSSLADLGLYTILVREISKPNSEEVKIIGNIFTLRIVSLTFFLIIAAVLLLFVPYPLEVKIGILICFLFSVFSSLAQVLTGVFQKYLKLYLVSLSDVIARIAQLCLLVAFAYFKSGLLFFIGAAAVSELIHFSLILIFARKITKFHLGFDWAYWKKILPSTLPIAASLIFVLIYFKLDTVLLSIMKPAYDVGVYSLAYKILEVVIFLPAIYVGLVMPLLSRTARADLGQFKKTFQKSFDVISIFALPLLIYFFITSEIIIKFIGGTSFGQAGDVLRILAIAIAFIFFSNLSGNAVVALDLQKKGMWIYFLGAVVNLGGNIILIPRFSYFATAWMTVATEVIITGLTFFIICNKIKFTINFNILGKSLLAASIMGLLILPLKNNLVLASLIAISYFPILYVFKGFSREDLKDIFSLKKSTDLPVEVVSE